MVDDQTFSTNETSGTVDRKRRTMLIGGIVLLIVAIVAIIVGVVVSQQGNKDSNTATSSARDITPAPGVAATPAPTEVSPPMLPPASDAPETETPREIPLNVTVAPSAGEATVPVTSVPATPAPVSSAPVTAAPVAAPVKGTSSPIVATLPPISKSPVTASPVSAPVVAATSAPAGAAPVADTFPPVDLSLTPTAKLISTIAIFGGSEFTDPNSYQSKALAWLEGQISVSPARQTVPDFSDERLVQRYALACIYYATNGVGTPYSEVEYGEGVKPRWITETNWLGEGSECEWYKITCNGDNQVIAIELTSNRLSGSFPREVTLLKDSLNRLDLYENAVANEGDEGNAWLGELVNLKYLFFGSTYFVYDGIPTEIGLLTNLIELDCSYTLYFGELKGETFKDLVNLNYLVMGGNAYNSSVPKELAELPDLEYLYIDNSFLEGDLSFVTSMPKIFELWVDVNPGLTGTIPENIGDVQSLQSISWTECGLTGSLPQSMSNMTDMQQLWLYRNDLTGTVPTEFGSMARLSFFEIYDNQITGAMPAEVCLNTQTGIGTLTALSSDCDTDEFSCDCCTCCGTECYDKR